MKSHSKWKHHSKVLGVFSSLQALLSTPQAATLLAVSTVSADAGALSKCAGALCCVYVVH